MTRPAAHGLLHRHDAVHRLQGVRGGVQGVERACPTTASSSPAMSLRQHRASSARRRGGTWSSSSRAAADGHGLPLADAARTSASTARGGCLEVCPTGAIVRTEFGSVFVQPDVCNGCGYCVVACPFGVIDRREDDGRAWKCTLCYDRLKDGQEPACAKACPTESIQFGELDELRERAAGPRGGAARGRRRRRGAAVRRRPGRRRRRLRAFFLLLDEPEVYGLPPDPVSTTRDLPDIWQLDGAGGGRAGRRRGGGVVVGGAR